jgi:endonuclease/exonuclease/phosphatase (EEP) superfamily protein YafD
VSRAANPTTRYRSRGVLGRACLGVLLAAQTLVLTSVVQGTPAQAAVVESDSDITVVTANLRAPQSATRFQADAREVIAQDPDLITYNEVYNRQDMFLAPEGYELWRTPGHYLGNSPVAWRSETWRAVDEGTWQISDYPTRPPGKNTYLGRRYASWVSLESIDGRRLSVVSAHIAPMFKDDKGRWVDLLRPSVRRINRLVGTLSSHGPVLVGGDFNVHYRSGRYPRDLLTEGRLRPTYDLLGTYFPTGDHHGATIDYVFVRAQGQLRADWHRKVELNSDHDAVVAGLSWATEAPDPVIVVRSQPDGTSAERRAAARALRQQLAQTTDGETVQLATSGLTLPIADRALRRADARGVRVQVTTLSRELTWRERRLVRTLDSQGSWLRRCQDACRTQWQQHQSPTLVLVTDAGGDDKVRLDVSRRLTRDVITRRTTARTATSRWALEDARAAFAGL